MFNSPSSYHPKKPPGLLRWRAQILRLIIFLNICFVILNARLSARSIRNKRKISSICRACKRILHAPKPHKVQGALFGANARVHRVSISRPTPHQDRGHTAAVLSTFVTSDLIVGPHRVSSESCATRSAISTQQWRCVCSRQFCLKTRFRGRAPSFGASHRGRRLCVVLRFRRIRLAFGPFSSSSSLPSFSFVVIIVIISHAMRRSRRASHAPSGAPGAHQSRHAPSAVRPIMLVPTAAVVPHARE